MYPFPHVRSPLSAKPETVTLSWEVIASFLMEVSGDLSLFLRLKWFRCESHDKFSISQDKQQELLFFPQSGVGKGFCFVPCSSALFLTAEEEKKVLKPPSAASSHLSAGSVACLLFTEIKSIVRT